MGPSAATTALMEAAIEYQKPIYHLPTDLGINEFKRQVRLRFRHSKKAFQNRLIKAYKKRSWMEFEGVTKGRGTFPTHPVYGKKLKVKKTGLEVETEIKVTHGKQHKK